MYQDEIYKTCTRCKEDWPPDEEFYRPGHSKCIACEYEIRQQPAARKASVAKRKSSKTS